MHERLQAFKLYYQRHERRLDVVSFTGGFLFDVATLARVDSWVSIGQQVVYLVLIGSILLQMFFDQGRPPRDLDSMSRPKRLYYEYRTAAVHFLLGALLSLYTLFFFKSSSLLVSFGFLTFLVAAMLLNEWHRFKALGLAFKFAMLSLCVLSCSAVVVPVLVGSIGTWVFLLSMLVGVIPIAIVDRRIAIHAPARVRQARKQITVPFGMVLIGFLLLYLFRLIPPVPVSIPFIGVYHAVERTEQGYWLSHERPPWRFWQHGDQDYKAQPGDRIFVFLRIFSPAHFADQVTMQWYWKADPGGWRLEDSIPIAIVGGRAQGFRGYGVKSNYQPGKWKVQVETTDGREIGRIYFSVETVPPTVRVFERALQ